MKKIRTPDRAPAAGLVVGTLLAGLLAGCGGSGGGDAGPPPPPPAATTTPVGITVIDGAIANATVCLDTDRNGACDSGEPSGKTDASGKATLEVPDADVGKHPVVAVVGTDAVDADSGAVTTAFTMKAPADSPALVSPLTTMVQTHIENTGVSTAEATAHVKQLAALSGSPMTDYRGSGGDAATATVARTVVLALQHQISVIAGAAGSNDSSGAPITKADVDGASAGSVLNMLRSLTAAASDPAVAQSGNPQQALTTAAQAVVDRETDLSATTAASVIGVNRLIQQAAATPTPASDLVANATMSAFTHTNASNWQYRAYPSTAADNTPDANGLTRFYDLHVRNTNGATSSWGYGTAETSKDDLHWNGSGWSACPLGTRSTATARNAAGVLQSNYCQNHTLSNVKVAIKDVAGKRMTDVLAEIRALPGGDSGMLNTNYGPTDLSLLGTETFPAGSQLRYYTTARQASAPAYVPTNTPQVRYPDAVIAGGAATDSPSPVCLTLTAANFTSFQQPVTTLEELIAANPQNKPCVFNTFTDVNGTSDPAPKLWVYNTLDLGTLVGGATTPVTGASSTFYTSNLLMRVAFASTGNGTTYYSCRTRTTGGSVWACQVRGSGTWSITEHSDGSRVLSFTNQPAIASSLGSEAIYIQRGTSIYRGYRQWLNTTTTARLNLPAINALFSRLSIPPLVPQ